MALTDSITVNEFSAPLITKQLLDFRNDTLSSSNGPTNSQNILPITGAWTFQLIIKRTPVGLSTLGVPQVYDPDTAELKYTGTLTGNAGSDGAVQFQLDLNATCCYGNYVGEIRWWSATAPTSGPPTDRVQFGFSVVRSPSTTYP